MMLKIYRNITVYLADVFSNDEINRRRRTLIFFLVIVFILMCLSYFSLLIQTIFNVVEHQDLENSIPKFNVELQQKKFELISLRSDLNLDEAESMGLVVLEDVSVEYITRDPIGFRGLDSF